MVISCQFNSIIDLKKYYKLIITPWELRQAIAEGQQDMAIRSDLRSTRIYEPCDECQQQEFKPCYELESIHKGELSLGNVFQTLAFYQDRQYQGMQQEIGTSGVLIESRRQARVQGEEGTQWHRQPVPE